MDIVRYPHPALRHTSKPLKKVDKRIRDIVRQMFTTMYDAKGVGLAANQVDLPFQLFIVNLAGDPDSGEEIVCINPVVHTPRGQSIVEEGCLSLPGLYAAVARPEYVQMSAFDLQGNEIEIAADGMLARAIQHEYDHLLGTLFIDRIDPIAKRTLTTELQGFEMEYEAHRLSGKMPGIQETKARLAKLESEYC